MIKRGKIFGIPVAFIAAAIAAYLFRDKLKPLFDKLMSLFNKNNTPTA